jgi:hypothetical protein
MEPPGIDRQLAPPRPATPRRPVARPDARPMRAILGFTGIAAASAIATAIVRPPAAYLGQPAAVIVGVADQAAAPARHVTRYIQLLPGQTAPPNAAVQAIPQPTPRVVIVTTHQSGVP